MLELAKLHFHSSAQRAWVEALIAATKAHYGARLESLAIFGSWARGENRRGSDLDLLAVIDEFKDSSKRHRHRDFIIHVEEVCDELGMICHRQGLSTDVSCLLLTPAESKAFNPLYLDMVEHNVILRDRDDRLQKRLTDVREKMARWGSRKVPASGGWAWQIKQGIKTGEVVDYDQ